MRLDRCLKPLHGGTQLGIIGRHIVDPGHERLGFSLLFVGPVSGGVAVLHQPSNLTSVR
jgi:hypothetical protein